MTFAALLLCAVTFLPSCEEDNKEPGGIPPGAVVNFTASAGNAQVSLAWEAPADDEIIPPATGYELTPDNWTSKVTKTASELSHTFTELTNGTEYTFKIRAVNANGAGAESTATATPMAGGNDGPFGDWTLSANVKIKWKENTGMTSTSIKIGNKYWKIIDKDSPISEYYIEFFPLEGRAISYIKNRNTGIWALMFDLPETEETFRRDYIPLSIYGSILEDRMPASSRPVSGYSTVVGRQVQIRINAIGSVKYYFDVEHQIALKRDFNNDMVYEVIEWDETVTDFGGIDLPE